MDIIKKLSRSIREYKMVSIMTPVCIVFEVIFEILIPFMMAKMIDLVSFQEVYVPQLRQALQRI